MVVQRWLLDNSRRFAQARVQRDRDMLVGELVPAEATDWSAEATVAQVVGEDRDLMPLLLLN